MCRPLPTVLLLGSLACAPPVSDKPTPSHDAAPGDAVTADAGRTRIVFLGTGTPAADPARSGPAVAVVVDDTPYLVDFGPGVVRRAVEAYQRGTIALHPTFLELAFVTHLHSDHTAGYPDLVFTTWVLGRDRPLHVYGPPGIGAMTEHLLAAWSADIEMRVNGLEGAPAAGARVVAHEIEAGRVYEDERVRVEAVPVDHGSWEHAFAYLFETPDRRILISGDAAPSDSLVEAARGVDVLVHEVYSQTGFDAGSESWQRYHASFHTSSRQLAELATRSEPGLLILYHQLFFGTSEAELLTEVRRGTSVPVVSARDLEVY